MKRVPTFHPRKFRQKSLYTFIQRVFIKVVLASDQIKLHQNGSQLSIKKKLITTNPLVPLYKVSIIDSVIKKYQKGLPGAADSGRGGRFRPHTMDCQFSNLNTKKQHQTATTKSFTWSTMSLCTILLSNVKCCKVLVKVLSGLAHMPFPIWAFPCNPQCKPTSTLPAS